MADADLTAGAGLGAAVTQASANERRRRVALYLLSISPLLALVALLGWGLARSGGNPGGLLVNSAPGEIAVETRQAPAFSVATLDGGPLLDNEALRGKVVFLDFWSSWCPPCRAEAADLAAVYHEYEGRPVEFLGMAIWDDPGDVLRHLGRFDVTYPNALDEQGQIAVSFGVRGVPEKFFIDPDGLLVMKFTGPISPERLRQALDELLASDY